MIAFIIAQIAKIKAAIAVLNGKILTGSVSNDTSKTFTVANYTRAILMTTGPDSNRCTIYFVCATSNGTITIASERTGGKITLTSSENNKVTLAAADVASYFVVVCNGSVS